MTQGERGKRNAEMIRLYRLGKSLRDIAKLYDMSFQNVQQTLRKYGAEPHPQGRWPKYFVLEDYVSIIAEMREIGRGVHYIARLIGIHPLHIQWDEFAAYVKAFPKYGGNRQKRCPKCGIVGSLDLFYERGGYCKVCQNAYYAERRRVQKSADSIHIPATCTKNG